MLLTFVFYFGKLLLFLSNFLQDSVGLPLALLLNLFDSAFLHLAYIDSGPSLMFKHGLVPLLLFHQRTDPDSLNSHFVSLADLSHHVVAMKSIFTDISLSEINSS